MAQSSPEGITLGKGSQLVSMELSINKEKVLSIKQEKLYTEEELLRFGKSCFYKGFDKAENDDANCYTAFREEILSLFQKFKKK